MGLDMYANKVKFQPDSEIDFSIPEDSESTDQQIFYWRKHSNLHGWMENLYNHKGGTDEFNCVKLQLTLEDLNSLERDLNSARLPQTSGFFFGRSQGSLEEINNDLSFVKEAKTAISEGYIVYYNSWW